MAYGGWILGCNIEETEARTNEVSGAAADSPSDIPGASTDILLDSKMFESETRTKSKSSKE